MHNITSTYRIQFNKEFTLANFKEIIPYLHQLGVKTVYASPIFEASPGSMHGYDTVNPLKINPEIGDEQELRGISDQLKSLAMNWVQDIVPNHMAFHQNNIWLMDVLEKGPDSEYYNFFDINWAGNKNQPIMVPFLGNDLETVIKNNELKVIKTGKIFQLDYFGASYPLNAAAQKTLKQEDLEAFNQDGDKLLRLANAQYYRLCSWMETDKKINYRRFFTVNSLICLNIHRKEVFLAYHQYILSLLGSGVFQGLRVDHVDGLFDPSAYMEMLREVAGEDTYIVVEKILEEGEELPEEWPIQGATGYEFLATLNNLLVNKHAEHEFTKYYQQLVNSQQPISEQIFEKKRAILRDHMAGELDNLVQLFQDLDLTNGKSSPEPDLLLLKEAIAELLIHCPVYRYYGNELPLSVEEETNLEALMASVETYKLKPALQILRELWIEAPHHMGAEYSERAALFYKRFMQFSGPLMAKGVEDTLMYTYNRFIGKNEVGDSPEGFGKSGSEFHKQMLERQQNWPSALNGTSTHDTKRGEDVRARLQILTDLHVEWLEHVKEWQRINQELEADKQPDDNDAYFIYQTLVGSHPMPGTTDESYQPRMDAYLEKALREAKTHTGWSEPNTAYENAAKDFTAKLISDTAAFQESFNGFHRKISDYGILNSLAQVVLKFTCPGVPDVYQGTELWDFSLVDPDNRRPVDYVQRANWLNEFKNTESLAGLWEDRYTGKIKLWLEHTLLKLRQQIPFVEAEYIPLQVKGSYEDNILAFARRYESNWVVTIVPLHLATLSEAKQVPFSEFDWKDTMIHFPQEAPETWQNLLTNKEGKVERVVPVATLLGDFPLAVITMEQPKNNRGAGILMHITSLPSPFGIGDLGPEAYKFVQSLSRSNQTYWQLLPLNPITSAQNYSPYSSISSIAGNTLLISPEFLEEAGLLTADELKSFSVKKGNWVNYPQVEESKSKMFDLAYQRFKSKRSHHQSNEYLRFLKAEADWLDDFALFTVLKDLNGHRPWNEWPEKLKQRDEAELLAFKHENKDQLTKAKWLQFLFYKQWNTLKVYATKNQVRFVGDLPFYVSYDSVDVWANPSLFKLDESGEKLMVAGVPPDYFNEEGQLWGMPVYRWDVMAQNDYGWWKQRLRKNMELYDLLRLDHFRAFSSYWEVPAEESTAVNGEWLDGPGSAFFAAIKQQFGDLPFIAEDLGDVDDAVYELREEFDMPGMKVLQFAFGEDIATSIHIPHNYTSENCIAYTGTHDNNTTKGWYKNESSKVDRRNLSKYIGVEIDRKNVSFQLIRLAYASTARLAIIPIQDILNLGKSARMNTPSSTTNNWGWRMKPGTLTSDHEARLHELGRLFGRY
jgi:malto-oligosyltrehalose synthase/4-alpha-glucanotransferase